ncbi:hypothetical protein [Ruminococcus sp.]|uniref:hypothetical protein n=1 Tax=Ruminococcus sp. TaxID=41978 RepID=UPI002CBB0519|nr:hypothetical protein [Ruminococcus sp.]HNZ98370.1 hypothetical protein [Ruminococcus sp.]HOH87537.1 hypothetical protein [Ruminococcus sp.]
MEEVQKKKKSPLKTLIIVFIVLAVLGVGGFWFLCEEMKMTTGSKVNTRNAAAQSYLKAVSAQVEDVYKEKGEKVPADKEYIIRGKGQMNDPCELLEESVTNRYTSDTRYYWVVKFRDGTACEAWSALRPIEDSELRYYSRKELIDKSNEHPMKQDKLVIGYYSTAEGNTYTD